MDNSKFVVKIMPSIHHLGFLVRDLDQAIDRYSRLLGEPPVAVEALQSRGVATARFALGPIWLVLIEPKDATGIPGQHLSQHGEGFFMLSLNSDKLETTADELSSRELSLDWSTLRDGLDNWRVADLNNWQPFGAVIQFAQETAHDEKNPRQTL
ncbi:MAG: VOC family protein [Lysobacterales bacterium]